MFGVVRYVAMRYEQKAGRRREVAGMSAVLRDREDTEDDRLSRVFDRAWAQSIMRQAAAHQAEHAREAGEDAMRRVELLRMRFQEGLPVREIAARWKVDPVHLHREYARARKEFRQSLMDVVRYHCPGTPGDIERESAELLALLE
jgi:RNA polymerase sigma-70 factor (ECF subfamily)